MAGESDKKYILWFDEISIGDVPIVGGKNASLGEMYQKLHDKGIMVPNGFAITAYAYRYFLKHAGIEGRIEETLEDLDTHDLNNLMRKGRKIREIIKDATMPPDLTDAICEAYDQLAAEFGQQGLAHRPLLKICLTPLLRASRTPF